LRAAAATEHAAEEHTRQARHLAAAAAKGKQPSAGRRAAQAAAAVLAAADRLAARAQQEDGIARHAAAAAAQAEEIKSTAKTALGRSRIALRMAGTSHAGQQALLAQYTRRLTDAREEQQRAERAAAAARRQAWQTLHTSSYAEAFRVHGALGEAPDDPAAMRQWLAAMHARLPTLARQIDAARTEAAQQTRREAATLRTRASELRVVVEQLQAERQLRRQINGQAPQRHASDETARAALQQERRHIAQDAQQTRQRHPRPSDGVRTNM